MTTNELILKLRNDVKLLKERPLALAALSVHAMVAERIFEKGRNAAEGKIGTYSTTPMLASKGQFTLASKFKQSLRTSGVVFTSNIKTKKTTVNKAESKKKNKGLWIKFKKAKKAIPIMIIEGGYREFRKIQGKESSFVNLKYRGLLQKDFSNSLQKVGGYWISGVKNKANVGKVEGAIDKYGDMFKLTKKESEELKRIASAESLKILNNA